MGIEQVPLDKIIGFSIRSDAGPKENLISMEQNKRFIAQGETEPE